MNVEDFDNDTIDNKIKEELYQQMVESSSKETLHNSKSKSASHVNEFGTFGTKKNVKIKTKWRQELFIGNSVLNDKAEQTIFDRKLEQFEFDKNSNVQNCDVDNENSNLPFKKSRSSRHSERKKIKQLDGDLKKNGIQNFSTNDVGVLDFVSGKTSRINDQDGLRRCYSEDSRRKKNKNFSEIDNHLINQQTCEICMFSERQSCDLHLNDAIYSQTLGKSSIETSSGQRRKNSLKLNMYQELQQNISKNDNDNYIKTYSSKYKLNNSTSNINNRKDDTYSSNDINSRQFKRCSSAKESVSTTINNEAVQDITHFMNRNKNSKNNSPTDNKNGLKHVSGPCIMSKHNDLRLKAYSGDHKVIELERTVSSSSNSETNSNSSSDYQNKGEIRKVESDDKSIMAQNKKLKKINVSGLRKIQSNDLLECKSPRVTTGNVYDENSTEKINDKKFSIVNIFKTNSPRSNNASPLNSPQRARRNSIINKRKSISLKNSQKLTKNDKISISSGKSIVQYFKSMISSDVQYFLIENSKITDSDRASLKNAGSFSDATAGTDIANDIQIQACVLIDNDHELKRSICNRTRDVSSEQMPNTVTKFIDCLIDENELFGKEDLYTHFYRVVRPFFIPGHNKLKKQELTVEEKIADLEEKIDQLLKEIVERKEKLVYRRQELEELRESYENFANEDISE